MIKKSYIIFPIYIVLLFGFFLNADPNGGAFLDYQNHLILISDLKNNFYQTLLEYDNYKTRHSPILYILISILYKINFSDLIIRLISVHVCLFLPFIFYQCILLKYKNIDKNSALIVSYLIILSPSFWSLSIWPDSRIYGLIFFTLSIYYYLKFEIENRIKFSNTLKCILSYTISAYFSPNFAIFSIFYFYNFYKKYSFSKEMIYIFFLNLILSIPAFIYLFSLETVFIFQSSVPAGTSISAETFNFSNKILIISSIILFYSIPFLITKSLKLNLSNLKINLISIFILIFCVFYFNYKIELTGGGIFLKLSQFVFKNNYLFYIICLFAIIFILNFIKNDVKNFILIFLIILSNPQYSIYHKYYDPLIFILFILLFSINLNIRNFLKTRSIIIFYLFTGSFLIFNFFK